MISQSDRNEQVQYLLEEVFFAALETLEHRLCGHESTEGGFYEGALAAVAWTRKGINTLTPGDAADVLRRLEEFVKALQEDSKASPSRPTSKDDDSDA